MRFTFGNLSDILGQKGLNTMFPGVDVTQAVSNIVMTLLLALVIYWIYKKTFTGVLYSKNFNITLVLVSLVTCVIVMVISGNIALALGMVGALSIVRFRAAVKDPKDIAFLFWSITNGIVCGAGAYKLAVISAFAIGLAVYMLSKKIVLTEPYLLIIKADDYPQSELLDLLRRNCHMFKIRSSSITEKRHELTVEVKVKNSDTLGLLAKIKDIKGIRQSSLISYAGDIDES